MSRRLCAAVGVVRVYDAMACPLAQRHLADACQSVVVAVDNVVVLQGKRVGGGRGIESVFVSYLCRYAYVGILSSKYLLTSCSSNSAP